MRKKLANLGRIHCVVSILWILDPLQVMKACTEAFVWETRQI